MTTRRRTAGNDEGFTLPELLIYSLLLVIVMGIIGSLLISMLTVEQQVRTVTSATTSAQLASNVIQDGVRNARAFAVSDIGLLDADDQVLLASVASNDDPVTWHCAAWYFSAADSTIRYKLAGVQDTPIDLPTAAELQQWSLLSENVKPPASGNIFSSTGTQLSLEFTTEAQDETAVTIDSSATSRAGQWESAPCF